MIRNRPLALLALLASLGAAACSEDIPAENADPAGMGAGQPDGVEPSPPQELVDIALPRDSGSAANSAATTSGDTAGLAARDTTQGRMR